MFELWNRYSLCSLQLISLLKLETVFTFQDDDSKRADLLQLMLNTRRDNISDDIGEVGGDASHLALDNTGVWSKGDTLNHRIVNARDYT